MKHGLVTLLLPRHRLPPFLALLSLLLLPLIMPLPHDVLHCPQEPQELHWQSCIWLGSSSTKRQASTSISLVLSDLYTYYISNYKIFNNKPSQGADLQVFLRIDVPPHSLPPFAALLRFCLWPIFMPLPQVAVHSVHCHLLQRQFTGTGTGAGA